MPSGKTEKSSLSLADGGKNKWAFMLNMNICQTHVSFGPFLNSNKPANVALKYDVSVSVRLLYCK